jgi:tryptophanyl-tRNA synthetase
VASLDKILARGAERAREVAATTLRRSYEKIGFVLPE